MNNPKAQATLGTRHRIKTNKINYFTDLLMVSLANSRHLNVGNFKLLYVVKDRPVHVANFGPVHAAKFRHVHATQCMHDRPVHVG